MGLVVCNRGNSKTFSKGSIVDLTIATPHTAQRTTKWTVLDEETLSDHYYLSFEITHGPLTRETLIAPKIDLQKRKTALAQESADEERDAKSAKRDLVRAIKKAKEAAWKNLCDQVQNDPWGLPYKLIMGKLTRPPPIPELNTPGRLQRIVDGLFPQHPIRSDSEVLPATDNYGDIPLIDRAELISAARSLKNNISPGPDCIPNEVIKMIASLNPDLLAGVYNTCLLSGVFPKTWKKARLVIIRKADKPLDTPSSYRPLCLLDCLGKLLEKILDNRLRQHLDAGGGLHDRQFGFRKGRSTIDALEMLRTTVKSDKSKVGILTLDIQNAFNSALWDAILKAIYEKDVPNYLQRIIRSYLENRLLIYESGGIEEEMVVTCGVPQGSVLGPTLWNILYDGLLCNRLPPGVEYLAFADDVALVAKARDSIRLEKLLSSSAQIGTPVARENWTFVIAAQVRGHDNNEYQNT
ncbi:hypothetical protein QTP88_020895 [Uroleucon formosanum]